VKTLRQTLGIPVLFHRVGWHGKSTPNLAGYDSRNPTVIAHQFTGHARAGRGRRRGKSTSATDSIALSLPNLRSKPAINAMRWGCRSRCVWIPGR
jgi:hypothetical protein